MRTPAPRPTPVARSGCALAGPLTAVALALAAAPWAALVAPMLDCLTAVLPIVPFFALAALMCGRWLSKSGIAACISLALAATLLVPEAWPRLPSDPPGGPRLIVVTHNVEQANEDVDATVRSLTESNADVLLLQEVDGRMRPALDQLRQLFPYGSRCVPRCSMAILSRWPTASVHYRFRDVAGRPFGPALEQTLVYRPGVPPFPVVTVHLSRHRSPSDQAAERTALAAAIAAQPRDNMVLAGDLNLTPWSAGLRALDTALRPLRRITRGVFSWPARLGSTQFPFPLAPIDHVYVGPRWAVARVTRLARTGSDHYPICVELIWRISPPMLSLERRRREHDGAVAMAGARPGDDIVNVRVGTSG